METVLIRNGCDIFIKCCDETMQHLMWYIWGELLCFVASDDFVALRKDSIPRFFYCTITRYQSNMLMLVCPILIVILDVEILHLRLMDVVFFL